MVDYQGNSKKEKEAKVSNQDLPEKNLEKVVSGEVVIKPQGVGSRFKNIFFGGDMTTASQYVVGEIILPALRNLLWETISKGTERVIFPDSVHRRRAPTYTPRVQYNNPIYRQEPARRSYLPD